MLLAAGRSQAEVARELGGAQRVSRWHAVWRWGVLDVLDRNHTSRAGGRRITAADRLTRAGAAYAAAVWAFAFAAPHLYWAMGGTTGLTTSLNKQILDHRTAGFLAGLWGIAALCVAGGLVALATVRPWGRRLPRPVLRALAWFGFVLLAARAVDIYVEFGLGLTGITTVAAGERAEFLRLARWFLFLWLPWFILGAVAWGALAARRGSRGRPSRSCSA